MSNDLKDEYILKTGRPVFAWQEDEIPSYLDEYTEWLERELLKLKKEVNIKHLKRK